MFDLRSTTYENGYNDRPAHASHAFLLNQAINQFNLAAVREYLMRTQTDPAFQVALIEEAMSNYHRYFFIMPTLARFELEMHTRAKRERRSTPTFSSESWLTFSRKAMATKSSWTVIGLESPGRSSCTCT